MVTASEKKINMHNMLMTYLIFENNHNVIKKV
jgi:hypothetical protein